MLNLAPHQGGNDQTLTMGGETLTPQRCIPNMKTIPSKLWSLASVNQNPSSGDTTTGNYELLLYYLNLHVFCFLRGGQTVDWQLHIQYAQLTLNNLFKGEILKTKKFLGYYFLSMIFIVHVYHKNNIKDFLMKFNFK
jgi:hypothetical protein